MEDKNDMEDMKDVEVRFDDFSMYHVDFDYMKYLWTNVDKQVFFRNKESYMTKPYLGIAVGIGSYTYFIPFTSAKEKQKNWKYEGYDIFRITEIVDKDDVSPTAVIIRWLNDGKQAEVLLAVLDLKKMIPVPEGRYLKVDVDGIEDFGRQVLVRKEYEFCRGIQKEILAQVKEIYIAQKTTSKIDRFYCNYTALEEACNSYSCKEPSDEDSKK